MVCMNESMDVIVVLLILERFAGTLSSATLSVPSNSTSSTTPALQ
jgi:hypothetical protein